MSCQQDCDSSRSIAACTKASESNWSWSDRVGRLQVVKKGSVAIEAALVDVSTLSWERAQPKKLDAEDVDGQANVELVGGPLSWVAGCCVLIPCQAVPMSAHFFVCWEAPPSFHGRRMCHHMRLPGGSASLYQLGSTWAHQEGRFAAEIRGYVFLSIQWLKCHLFGCIPVAVTSLDLAQILVSMSRNDAETSASSQKKL